MSFEWTVSQILLLSAAELLLLGLWFRIRSRRRTLAPVEVQQPAVEAAGESSDDPSQWFVLDTKTRLLFDRVMAGAERPIRPVRSRVALGTQGHPSVPVLDSFEADSAVGLPVPSGPEVLAS